MMMPAIRDADLERFAQKGDSSLPAFSYAGPVLHHSNNTVILGDTIHTVKPYFGERGTSNRSPSLSSRGMVSPRNQVHTPTTRTRAMVLARAEVSCSIWPPIPPLLPLLLPRFFFFPPAGQGVNSAFEDVRVLERALDEARDRMPSTVTKFTALRAKDAEALVELSHSLDGGFLTFIVSRSVCACALVLS
jgi:hypothetical protein